MTIRAETSTFKIKCSSLIGAGVLQTYTFITENQPEDKFAEDLFVIRPCWAAHVWMYPPLVYPCSGRFTGL